MRGYETGLAGFLQNRKSEFERGITVKAPKLVRKPKLEKVKKVKEPKSFFAPSYDAIRGTERVLRCPKDGRDLIPNITPKRKEYKCGCGYRQIMPF
jgi:hypothetical protein